MAKNNHIIFFTGNLSNDLFQINRYGINTTELGVGDGPKSGVAGTINHTRSFMWGLKPILLDSS
ncbi:MAG: hypothetical protein ABJN65_03585 [Parasphingorhabdus sp.]